MNLIRVVTVGSVVVLVLAATQKKVEGRLVAEEATSAKGKERVPLELSSRRLANVSTAQEHAVNTSDFFNTNSSSQLVGNTSAFNISTSTTTTTTAPTQQQPPSLPSPTSSPLDGMQGALVTSDCLFEDGNYPYAVDIFWSCGDERFHQPLRLHTFKRHSRSHKLVFADQSITYRDGGRLWFDSYPIARCIRVVVDGDDDDDDEFLQLSTNRQQCTQFDFLPTPGGGGNGYRLQDVATGRCMGLGTTTSCSSDRSTGGSECGGVDHRFLPLVMGDSSAGLVFRFETEAQDCSNGRNERPENACF